MFEFKFFFQFFLFAVWIANGSAAEDTFSTEDLDPIYYSDVNDPSFSLLGYASSPKGKKKKKNSLPAVVILPDWDNVNDYEIARAKMISEELGYVAFTADLYGADMHNVQDFDVKVQMATMLRSNVDLFNGRIQSAINAVKDNLQNVDPNKIAVIGYCLGGSGVLTYSFANTDTETSDIVGAVSFHGGLMDFNVTGEMASPVLVLSGGEDDAGTAVEDLEGRLKEANSTWQITRYSGVVHGFTKFNSSAYDEWVDDRSWKEMTSFLNERFGEIQYGTIAPTEDVDFTVISDAQDSTLGTTDVVVETVEYDDNGFALEGYIAMPNDLMEIGETRPAVVILPDWDGVNGPTGYEAKRAVMAAKEGGYIAMVADIYGTEYTDVPDIETRIQQATLYRSDPELFVGRIQTAVDLMVNHPAVNSSCIFVTGYCFGGTGSIDYAFSPSALENVKAVVPIHGGLTPLRAIQVDEVKPYVLVLSGGVDDAHGNTTELEGHLDGANTTWEISRYSYAKHGFTKWSTDYAINPAYDEMADSRSWWSMMSLFETMSPIQDKKNVKKTRKPKTKKSKSTKKTKTEKPKKPKKPKKTKSSKSS